MTVKAGNLAGTDGTPPQVPPKLSTAGSEVESGWRPGVAGGRLDADVDDVVGGDVGGRLKVTCRGHPRCFGDGALHRPAHRADVNWAPLSDVMVAGTPNRDTQPTKRAMAQSAAVMDESGMASGHLEVRSIIVKR